MARDSAAAACTTAACKRRRRHPQPCQQQLFSARGVQDSDGRLRQHFGGKHLQHGVHYLLIHVHIRLRPELLEKRGKAATHTAVTSSSMAVMYSMKSIQPICAACVTAGGGGGGGRWEVGERRRWEVGGGSAHRSERDALLAGVGGGHLLQVTRQLSRRGKDVRS